MARNTPSVKRGDFAHPHVGVLLRSDDGLDYAKGFRRPLKVLWCLCEESAVYLVKIAFFGLSALGDTISTATPCP